ncbi:rhodanese-like domain-containing protein [Terriglobus aquaticus]|jgi:rhodanese-related sulfurtransferase|uniref:Rhodanese-related sulfurtransferase n=2 Tax=Terriglobus TaxID=392733 RepID=A0A1H4W6J9_9BACT|nr:Rhodanese-related sulfurtransferase [Terriglobus roseus]
MRLIDVREYPEYAAEHIEGSELVPLGKLTVTCEAWDRSQPLKLVCRSGRRATQAKQLLGAKGFLSVEILDGGIEAWKHSGRSILTAQHKPWAMERQVRVVAGSLVLLFVLLGSLVWKYFFAAAGLVGVGLIFAGVSNTCMMASVLGRMPWNQPKKITA